MSMTLTEAKTEAKTLLDKAAEIENRYEGIIENGDDEREVKRLLTEFDTLNGQIAALEEKEGRRHKIDQNLERFTRPAMTHKFGFGEQDEPEFSPGDQFIRSSEYRHMSSTGQFNSKLNRLDFSVQLKDGTSLLKWQTAVEQKALVTSGSASGGGFIINDVQAGYLNILQREINVMDLIPRLQTSSDTVEYIREDTFTNNAAMTAEATGTTGTSGAKPESVLAYSTQTSPVRTLAHWVPVTNRMLADAPAIRGIINQRLLLGLTLVLEQQMLTGGGTGEDFTGILNAGINVQGLGADNVLDALFKGRTVVRVTGHARPTAVVLHPNDWQAIRLSRENTASATLGGYLMGPPSAVGATTVWGLPVVESEALTENTGLVGDFMQGCTLFDREQASIRVGLINDQFTRNMQTILAELRAAFVVWRPTAFTRVTGI
jgi:HK97 family phage major capsid protein